MAVEDKDMGWDAAMEGIAKFVGASAKIGLIPPSRQEVIDRGAWNEFGTATIPARPFMRSAVDENSGEINAMFANELNKAIDGQGAGITDIAVAIQKMIKERIEDSPAWAEPNAPLTVDIKGFDHPLNDTGEMLDSISFVVGSADPT